MTLARKPTSWVQLRPKSTTSSQASKTFPQPRRRGAASCAWRSPSQNWITTVTTAKSGRRTRVRSRGIGPHHHVEILGVPLSRRDRVSEEKQHMFEDVSFVAGVAAKFK